MHKMRYKKVYIKQQQQKRTKLHLITRPLMNLNVVDKHTKIDCLIRSRTVKNSKYKIVCVCLIVYWLKNTVLNI